MKARNILKKTQLIAAKSFRSCAFLLILATASQPAFALDRVSILFIQNALNQHGFEAGEPDGKLGPATRRALAAFSDKYGAPDHVDGVMEFMIEKSIQAREEVTSEDQLNQIRTTVSENLRDPSSAEIRNVYKTVNGTDDLICGEVNGKNAYGGYAGFTKFYGTNFKSLGFWLMHIDDAETSVAEFVCLFSFPKQTSRQ
ncbi:hypothetical protein DSM14862_02424 [Sulfitobacter indolifex]|uniref:Peptidoglycan binding-like domain-containing protein n=1 Tax=Sulfitobacter indolifex HEL-45 TaxID=391624 RepID=A0ABM9X7H7_9RHOB|nr:peptidoglycan-binding protein [Sulfitobacter indolifex]EDQ05440.1 hypothetical protein OIHEL45_01480 [Sulfitobacter indolifex HEL-45]UOA19616.1 hypothetical protein DSM14862_02424 [Sulfitobacter indolifex]